MTRWTLFLLISLFAPCAAAAPEPAPTPQRVDAILEDQRLHGYRSPAAAIDRLQSASDVPSDNAPLDLRRRYYSALAALSLVNDPALNLASLARLQAMVDRENCKPCRVDALLIRAQAELNRGQIAGAESYLAEVRALIPVDDLQSHLNLGDVEARLQVGKNNLIAAVEQAVLAVKLAEQLGNTADQIRLLVLLVAVNADLGHVERANTIAEEAIALAKPIGFADAVGFLRLNQGHIYSITGERDKQFRALKAALAIAEREPGLAKIEVTSRSNLADYYLYQGDYRAALEHADRAATLAREIDDVRGLVVATANQGIAMSRLGDSDGGIDKLAESIALAEKLGHKGYVVGITHELVLVLEGAGRYREALDATQKIAAFKEEITLQEREKAVLEVQEKYASERKNREIERLSAENRLKAAEVEARTWQQRLWTAVAVALALAALPVLRRLLRAHRINRGLKDANADLTLQSVHDPLTGAFNRRYFQTLMRQQGVAPGKRALDADARESGGLVLLDIDHFKAINDSHGHAVGDRVLVEVARRLQTLVRDQDAVVRWGGEEFVLVLPGTPVQGLAVLATRVLRIIGGEPVRAENTAINVTVSAGCVSFPLNREKRGEDALQLADAAMYLAKQRGRNRAVCVMDIRDDAAPAAVADDLAAAETLGRVTLSMLPGPSRPVMVDAMAMRQPEAAD